MAVVYALHAAQDASLKLRVRILPLCKTLPLVHFRVCVGCHYSVVHTPESTVMEIRTSRASCCC